MKKALALILALLMLCATLVPVVSAATPTKIDLQELFALNGYASTYVGKALSATDAKPQQDGTIQPGEYQKEYFVSKDGSKDTYRAGSSAAVQLRNDYKEYVSHDEDWIYFAVDFQSCVRNTTNFYWNLSFIDSFEFDYAGGTAANTAFTQNGRGIKEGWLFGTRFDTTSTNLSNAVPANKTAPVENTDYVLASSKENLGESKWSGYFDFKNVHEIKISKQWYATQVGIAKGDVRELAWFTYAEAINDGASSYTHIAHLPTDGVLDALETEGGVAYTGTASNTSTNSDKVLPRFFILDDEPTVDGGDDHPTIPNNYSYKFKDVDARNYVAGQVIDVAAAGEAEAAPTMTGDKSEYQFTKTYYASNGSDPLNVYISVKDGYLYVAYESAESLRMQYNLGIAASQRSDSIASFARLTWSNPEHTGYTNQKPLIRNPGTAANLGGLNDIGTTNFMVADVYSNGLQEAKFDLDRLYRLFAGAGTAGHGVYDSPCVTLAFWNVKTGVYYDVAEGASINVDSTETVTHVPATIIIPDETFAAIRAKMGTVGEKGTDHRNMLDGQLLRLEEYAEVAPTLDGVIDPTEYTGSIQDGTQTAYFAVKDGYLYMATSYAGNTYKSGNNFFTYLRYGLANHGEHMGLNGVAFAERETWSQYFAIPQTMSTGAYATTGRNISGWFYSPKFASTGYEPTAIVDRGVGCGDELVYEWKFSIATLAMIFEETGWCADSANAFQFKLGQSVRDLSWTLSKQTNSSGAERLYTGLATGWLGTMLTVEFPEGCIEKYGRTEATTVDTNTTASTRLSPTNSGLRFKTNFYTQELYALVEQYGAANIKAGTLIAPTDTLGENKLTHKFGVAGVNYLDVPADLTIDPTTGYFANTFNGNNKLTTIAGSITNIKEKNLDRDFTGVGYIAYFDGAEWNYIYSNSVCERSVAYVAQAAVDAGEFEGNTVALGILEKLGAVLPAPEESEDPVAPEAN